MVRLLREQIEPSCAKDREIAAALSTLMLLQKFIVEGGVPDYLLLAVVGLLFKGNWRLLSTQHIAPFLVAIHLLGLEDAWESAVSLRLFQHIELPILPAMRIDLNSMSQNDCRADFRFDQDQIKTIAGLLPFPEVLITYQRDKCFLVEALCIVLKRMRYPNRWRDLSQDFARFPSALCRIFHLLMRMILERAMPTILMYPPSIDRLLAYVDAFHRHGLPLDLHVAFVIDVKKQRTCTPIHGERSMYTVHKKAHGPKYQTLESPDGLIYHCSRAADGRRSDPGILRDSQLLEFWRTYLGGFLILFRMLGDSVYPNNDIIMAMYRRPRNAQMLHINQLFNRIISPQRVTIEWGYEKIIDNWAFVDYNKNQKLLKNNVEAIWHLAVWLTNLKTCTNEGNQISSYFNVKPPSLEEHCRFASLKLIILENYLVAYGYSIVAVLNNV